MACLPQKSGELAGCGPTHRALSLSLGIYDSDSFDAVIIDAAMMSSTDRRKQKHIAMARNSFRIFRLMRLGKVVQELGKKCWLMLGNIFKSYVRWCNFSGERRLEN